MENDALPSNSKFRNKVEPERKVEKVVTGEVIQRKPPLGRRLKDTFISGDAHNVGQYVLFDVVIPAAKDAISDMVSQFVERMLFGDRQSGRRTPSRSGGSNSYVSYHNRYSSPPWNRDKREEPRAGMSRRGRAMHDFNEIVIPTRPEAETVIEHLFDLTREYGHATVNDLYELTGITGSFTDERYGWTDLRGLAAVRVSGGYLLDLPKPEPLD